MNTFVLAGGAYIFVFIYVAFKWPRFALAAIFASAPFQQDLAIGLPVHFSLAEVDLALATPVFFLRLINSRQKIAFGPMLAPIAIYLGVCMLSSIGDFRGQSTVVSFTQMLIYMIADVLVFAWLTPTTAELKTTLTATILSCVGLSIVSLVTGSNYILGLHKNGLGGSLSFGVVIGAELLFTAKDSRSWRLLFFATGVMSMGLIMSLSRGSWMGAIAGLLTVACLRQRFKFMLWSALALVPFMAACWYILPSDSKDFATGFDSRRANISARLDSIDFAQQQFEKNPIIGQGVGLRKEFDATNIVMTVLAETGIIGLIAFAWIHLNVFIMVKQGQKTIRPDEWNNSLLVLAGALLMAKFAHGLVDHYWSRGDLMLAWGAVGMGTRAYFVALKRAAAKPRSVLPRRKPLAVHIPVGPPAALNL